MMNESNLSFSSPAGESITVPATRVHTLVIGSGAAGLNAAVQLVRNNVKDVLILTEGLHMGTSINTGSDKQTYYKLSICGSEADSPRSMAESYFAGGSMHGDLALVEASLSVRAFMNLVNIGVPFPRDAYGQFVGYKTDHDPRQRATSIGPYTSKEMCSRLIEEVQRLNIPVREGREVVQLLVIEQDDERRAAGALAINEEGQFEGYLTENVIFAVGGPGGLYQSSVYPLVQNGGIGLALMAGVRADNLPESQFGLSSTKFRWNVSGTYMQVIPRVISRDSSGGDEREFLRDYFTSTGEMNGNIFLKGYQWPFDARKVVGGSSIIDILVYIETVVKGRQVFLDFRSNPLDYAFEDLPERAANYLSRSGALQDTPVQRLLHMNPGAVALYAEHGIDLKTEPLEVAICAQHNNGGLTGNLWWESTNTRHFFPVGEVNGSHGVSRPGGASLNAGQVGSIRAAEYIAHCYPGWSLPEEEAANVLAEAVNGALRWAELCQTVQRPCSEEMAELQARMTEAGAHIRSSSGLDAAVPEAWSQARRILAQGCGITSWQDLKMAFRAQQLCFAHAVYLDAIRFALQSGVGSRGSAIILQPDGQAVHPMLDATWCFVPEDALFRSQQLESQAAMDGTIAHAWVNCRPIPEPDSWFENIWSQYRNGDIYKAK